MDRAQDGHNARPLADEEQLVTEEREALGRILHAFHTYRSEADWEVSRWERNFSKLSPQHKALLPGHASKCLAAREAILTNQAWLSQLASDFDEPSLIQGAVEALEQRFKNGVRVSPGDAEKVRYVLKNAVRDWAKEGAAERAQSYGRICEEIQRHLPVATGGAAPRVLVPGCGLGRLPFELARLGYETQGNEYSFYMLLASSFILNLSEAAEQWTIHPWLLSNCNQLSDAEQLRGVQIPDVCIREVAPLQGLLGMSAGDFEEVYSRPEYAASYDCVVTCFFMDCAHNVISFIHIIHTILKGGGLWINLGPLLYHWADAHTYLPGEELSVELSLDSLEHVVQQAGFRTLQRCMVPAAFNTNIRSMLQNSYRCAFWTAQKSQHDRTNVLKS